MRARRWPHRRCFATMALVRVIAVQCRVARPAQRRRRASASSSAAASAPACAASPRQSAHAGPLDQRRQCAGKGARLLTQRVAWARPAAPCMRRQQLAFVQPQAGGRAIKNLLDERRAGALTGEDKRELFTGTAAAAAPRHNITTNVRFTQKTFEKKWVRFEVKEQRSASSAPQPPAAVRRADVSARAQHTRNVAKNAQRKPRARASRLHALVVLSSAVCSNKIQPSVRGDGRRARCTLRGASGEQVHTCTLCTCARPRSLRASSGWGHTAVTVLM